MHNISLTDFVDVVSKAGTPKATKVTEIKNRKPYHPSTDFYKPLRDEIIAIHQSGKSKTAIDAFYVSLTDQKKLTNYRDAVDGYKKWWGKKNITWFDPPRSVYSNSGIDVAINPELGLVIDGVRCVIKLYLKSEPLAKLRIDLVTVLMEVALRPNLHASENILLLDIRKSKTFGVNAQIKPTRAVVDAELAYIANLWDHV